LIELGTLGGFIVVAAYMWVLRWDFYLYLTPLLLLAGLLSIREEKEPQKTIKYNLVNFNDEEEDVLTKIER
jgi:hypothetical protein